MKAKLFILMIAAALSTSAIVAQEKKPTDKFNPEKRIEIRAQKTAAALMLDDATAAKFIPIYKEYLNAQLQCRPNCERGKNISDEQIKKNIESRMEAQQKALDVEKKYYKELSKVLNAKQLQKIFCKNKEFKQWNRNNKGKRAYGKACPAPGKCATQNCPKGECPVKQAKK